MTYRTLLLSGALVAALVTFAVFFPATGNDFVDYDDLGYVVNNLDIRQLDFQMLSTVFSRSFEACWLPLTMISLAIDYALWGGDAFGYHLTSVIIHCCSVFLACLLFAALIEKSGIFKTGEGKGSGLLSPIAIAAATAGALFFGLHPLRVESVAWVSERKDVLCIFFMISAMLYHLRHAGWRTANPSAGVWQSMSYWIVLLTASLSFLSKPAAVSLPLVLLIIDWYPLKNISCRDALLRAVIEKIPLFLMSFAVSLINIASQEFAITRAPDVAPLSRLLVACKALLFYLWQTLRPVGLAPLYPHPGNVHETSLSAYLPFLLLVVGITVFVSLKARHDRKWLALWLYYLAVLLPVLGIIQVGGQWIADRYTYLPALGISLLWGAGLFWIFERLRLKGMKIVAVALVCVAMLQLAAYTLGTVQQIRVWQNSETLETREITLFPHQVGVAYYSRAKYRNEQGRFAEALEDIDEALVIARRKKLSEKYSAIHVARADILRNLGRFPEALQSAESAIRESVVPPPDSYMILREELAILSGM